MQQVWNAQTNRKAAVYLPVSSEEPAFLYNHFEAVTFTVRSFYRIHYWGKLIKMQEDRQPIQSVFACRLYVLPKFCLYWKKRQQQQFGQIVWFATAFQALTTKQAHEIVDCNKNCILKQSFPDNEVEGEIKSYAWK